MSVAIIDYGMGNVASVQKALKYLNIESFVTRDFSEIDRSRFIILPGVGSFYQGITNLRKDGLADFLTRKVMEDKKPFLGICLGMQLIATRGTEPFETPGLGWVEGDVVKIDVSGKRIPHLGWNNISTRGSRYFDQLTNKNFYFIHSYHFRVSDDACISSTVDYGIEMVSSVQKDNIFATQFHPEKSQEEGLKVLKNFFEANA